MTVPKGKVINFRDMITHTHFRQILAAFECKTSYLGDGITAGTIGNLNHTGILVFPIFYYLTVF